MFNKCIQSGAQWCVPIAPATLEAEVGGLLEPGVLDQPGQHGKTPSPRKSSLSAFLNFHFIIIKSLECFCFLFFGGAGG